MPQFKRRQFWIDGPLQLHMLAYVLVLVTTSLLIVSFSILRGLTEASDASRQIFHSLDWVRDTLKGPMLLSSLLSILAAALVTLIWSHRFAGPLRVLSAAMARMKDGNLSGPVRIRTTDTHQDLVKEFAQMQDGLRTMIEADRKRVEALNRKVHAALSELPKDHAARKALETVAADLKSVCADFSL